MAAAISRRSALATIALGLGAVVAGCESVGSPQDGTAAPGPRRPEDPDNPQPTRVPPPDSAELLLALGRAQHLAETSRAITGAQGWRRTAHQQVQAALDEQVRVLEELLRAGDVPVPTLSPPTDTPSTDTASTTASPGDQSSATGDASATTASPADRAGNQLTELGRACLEDVTPQALEAISAVSAANLPVLLAIAGQRGATAAVFDTVPDWAELTGPTDATAASLLAAYHPAVYGFEVLAARSGGDEREVYERVLSPLRQVTRRITILAGDAAPPAPLGYGMPEGTDSTDGRRRIAGELIAALAPTIMGPTQGYVGDIDAVSGTVRLLAQAVRLARPWVPIAGFPGLQVPRD